MNSLETAFEARENKALQECRSSIDWYTKHKTSPRILYWIFQITAIVLTGIIPVLLLVPNVEKWVLAVPPAIATISASLSGIFGWRENWIRRASVLEMLKAELFLYETQTSPVYESKLDREIALNNFTQRITGLDLEEVKSWAIIQNRNITKSTQSESND